MGALASMTGFARVDGRTATGAPASPGADPSVAWSWEAKSVNGKTLDLRLRVPNGQDALEIKARAAAQRHLARGNVALTLTLVQAQRTPQLRVNTALLAQILEAARDLDPTLGIAPPRLDGLLALRGVLETQEPEPDGEAAAAADAALTRDLEAGLDQVLAELARMRRSEGERLHGLLRGHLDEIARLTDAARATAAAQPAALRARLQAQVAEILGAAPALAPERVVQEVALLVTRADIREELDRLDAHVAQARGFLTEGSAVGRRLDFLAQELHREANTLCSKSAELELTRIGLALKAAIEQMREQIQNVE